MVEHRVVVPATRVQFPLGTPMKLEPEMARVLFSGVYFVRVLSPFFSMERGTPPGLSRREFLQKSLKGLAVASVASLGGEIREALAKTEAKTYRMGELAKVDFRG